MQPFPHTDPQPPKPADNNVTVIELNEFNVDLLTVAIEEYDLPNIRQLFEFERTTYKTADRYNSGYLEPWVQWVSIHSGVPSSKHKIKHLGDVPDLEFKQCWEVLSNAGISTGVWGVMNGARHNTLQVKFFLPDPWTYSEAAFPNSLNNLLDLPRYAAKNYRKLKFGKLFTGFLKLLYFVLTSNRLTKIAVHTLRLARDLLRFGKKHFVYISWFDYLSTILFSKYKKKYNPKCSILFLNSLAHIEHHHWTDGPETITKPILYGLKNIDKILGMLFKQFPDDAFVVHSGLSQMNTNHETPWVLYRQKSPMGFLKALNLPAVKVEQNMTHDGNVFFKSNQEREQAFALLKNATMQGKPLFHVERNPNDECKLFYHLAFTDKVDESAEFYFDNKIFKFFKYFDEIVTRTGRHIPIGTIFSDTIKFPNHIFNHEFNKHLYHYLDPNQFPLKSNYLEELLGPREDFLKNDVLGQTKQPQPEPQEV